MTGPRHLSHEYAEMWRYCVLIGVLGEYGGSDLILTVWGSIHLVRIAQSLLRTQGNELGPPGRDATAIWEFRGLSPGHFAKAKAAILLRIPRRQQSRMD